MRVVVALGGNALPMGQKVEAACGFVEAIGALDDAPAILGVAGLVRPIVGRARPPALSR